MESRSKTSARTVARRRRENPVSGCPLTAALAAMGGKWKLIIVYWLAQSPCHFGALRRLMPGISQKVLTEQLGELMHDEIVHRSPRGAVPARVEYSLTAYGRSLVPLAESIRLWGRRHIERLQPQGSPPAVEGLPASSPTRRRSPLQRP